MKPILLFSIQFTLSLAAYALIGLWYVVPRLSKKPRETALQPLVWVHAFRMIGGTVLAPGAVGIGIPILFQKMIGYGDLITAFLALLALAALRTRSSWAISLVWLVVVVGMLDTINAIIQSMRYDVFTHALGVNWVIVTIRAGAARQQCADPLAAGQVAGAQDAGAGRRGRSNAGRHAGRSGRAGGQAPRRDRRRVCRLRGLRRRGRGRPHDRDHQALRRACHSRDGQPRVGDGRGRPRARSERPG